MNRRETPAPPSSPPALMVPGSLRKHTWKRFLTGPDQELLESLYIPALSEAVRYDRCCAYFSSSVLATAARGFGRLIERLEAMGDEAPKPAVRLIVNEELIREDVRAMVEAGDLSGVEEQLKRRFKEPRELLEKQRLAMLGWLVKKGLLEVRVGVMRHGGGIVHAKYGIATDPAGDAVIFSGSGNESAQGLRANYEQLEISTSWGDADRHRHFTKEFEALWKDDHSDVHTVSLPEALRLQLIKFAPSEPPVLEPSNALARQKAAMLLRFVVEAPYLPNGAVGCDATAVVDLWPHQRRVVETTAAAWPDGRLLCDEVGMGKTIEAILVLRRLMAGRGVRRALILLPAGLLRQWQSEFREKGGMIFPRLDGATLTWPDERVERVASLPEALEQDVLLMSRETARTENNLPILLAARPWDLVILDEAHAARRRKQEEGEFNSGTLLLNLLRQLQLRRKARGFLLMSATPMQTHPWEPWDLLSVLGEGGAWLSDFTGVRLFYSAVAAIRQKMCSLDLARRAAALVVADPMFPHPPHEVERAHDAEAVARKIAFPPPMQRDPVARWLRSGSPLSRRMHRNTRTTLREYYAKGMLPHAPPVRKVSDIVFDYGDPAERRVYDSIKRYIERRFEELEREKPGKGFVMTVYRRRASSSPNALSCSLQRRRDGLKRVAEQRARDDFLAATDVPEALGADDFPEEEGDARVTAAFPQDPQTARAELTEVERLLAELQALGGKDTKREKFYDVLRQVLSDGRATLIFTEYADTLEYLRDSLVDHYQGSLGTYSGEGGHRWDGQKWVAVTKDAVTKALRDREIRVLICTDAASEGLNLQAAGAVINYDLPWNPSKVEQRIGRVDRIGQTLAEIRVVNLFLQDSVDDKVYRALKDRCGLFVHFVGAMQPVLARARRMLVGQEPLNLRALEDEATKVELDPLADETYVESGAEAAGVPDTPLTRAQLTKVLSRLTGDFGPKAKADKTGEKLTLTGSPIPKCTFSDKVEVLERDRAVLPLSPLQPRLRDLADALGRTGERLPLVVGSFQSGAFRAAATYWVGNGQTADIGSVGELEKLVEGWDGRYPPPEEWVRAEDLAKKNAERRVREMETRAAEREQVMFQRQFEAARLRLLRELGRYLTCIAGDTSDLNGVFFQQMRHEESQTSQRLRRCHSRLGDFPDWPPDLRQELPWFIRQITDNQRKGRLLGKEVDAALEDPRWAAAL